MKLTVPIVCEDPWATNNSLCSVYIEYFTPDYGSCPDADGSFPGGCSNAINDTTFGTTILLEISAAETGQYGVAGKFNLFLQIPRTRGVAFLSVPYKLPTIEVEVLPESDRQWRGKLCTARNDPHMYTFDGRSYEHHAKEGDYILYRHSVYGNVEIYLPYGTAVRARIDRAPFMGREGGRVLDISVNPSIKDSSGNSTGLCGSLNGNALDDFDNASKFINDWNVQTNASLFSSSMYLKTLEPWTFKSCTCKKTIGGNSAYLCERRITGCTRGTLAGYKSCGEILNSRPVRSVTRQSRRPAVKIPVSHQQAHVRHRRDTYGLPGNDPRLVCENHLKAIQTLCEKIPDTHTNVSVENCVLDIQITNSSDWISISRQSMLDTCQNEIQRNSNVLKKIINRAEGNATNAANEVNTTAATQLSMAELNISKEIWETSEIIKERFCMNNCSDNGICKYGMCECNTGFGAIDCYIDITKPPEITGLLDHGLCDQKTTECSQVIVFGGEFTSSNLTCRFINVFFDIHGAAHNERTSTVPGHAETIVETICPFPGSRQRRSVENMFVSGFQVSVSNDGTHFNDDTQGMAYIYNSECQVYTFAENTKWLYSFSLKDGYCFIEGKCYFNGTVHVLQNMICDPSVNTSSWTTYQPLPKPTLDENGVSNMIVIVSSSVIGGILFLVIVVLVIIVYMKNAKKANEIERLEPKVHDNTYQGINVRQITVLSVAASDVYRVPSAKISGSQLAFERSFGDEIPGHLYERRLSEPEEQPPIDVHVLT